MEQKRVLAVHDISCVGKCSLTVALPIISSVGVEVSALPTAVLSTHTGGFEGYTYRDLTSDITPIANHWKSLDLKFDGIYTGFLGSFEQLDLVSKLFDAFKTENNLLIVDPVMADNGKMYTLFSKEFAKGMANLCKKADVIIPNITEACFMLGEEYKEIYDEKYIKNLLVKLGEFGVKQVVLTGVKFNKGKIGAMCYDRLKNTFDYYEREEIEGYYHGTGDVFGSALISAIMTGKSLKDATRIATDFTVNSIIRTKNAKTDIRFGVNFEMEIPSLLKNIGIK